MKTVINTTPDICDQTKVTVNPKIEENYAKRVNQEGSKGAITINQKNEKQRTERDRIVITTGDSVINYVNGWEMAEKVKKCIHYICQKFLQSEGKMSKGPCKTITYTKPRALCAACGRDDLDPNRSTELIAKAIADVDITRRSEKHVTVFDIIPRNDHLQSKAREVKAHLVRLCKENNFS